MRDKREYSINPNKGIYYTTKGYHDDIDYHYVVDFDKSDVDRQFQSFLDDMVNLGKKKGMTELKQQFRAIRDLLA